MKNFIKKSGETLIEALVSIMVLIMAGGVASSMIIAAIQQSALSEDYLIAQNLAYEAVEAMEDVRDTNKMLYPGMEECWMNLSPDPTVTPDSCDLNPGLKNSSEGKFYTINYGNTGAIGEYNHWYLGNESDSIPIATKLYTEPATGRYTHNSDEGNIESKFSRYIKVTVVSTDNSQITFDVVVKWQRGGKETELLLSNMVLANAEK